MPFDETRALQRSKPASQDIRGLEGNPDERTYNPMGTVHGGYAATLLDSACGIATHSKLGPGQTYTTLELKVAYHRSMTAEIGRVRATGSVTSFGRRIAFAEAKLTDQEGRLLATASSTLLIITSPGSTEGESGTDRVC